MPGSAAQTLGIKVNPRWYIAGTDLPSMWGAGNIHLGTATATMVVPIAAAGQTIYNIAPQSDVAGTQQIVLGKKGQEIVRSPKDLVRLESWIKRPLFFDAEGLGGLTQHLRHPEGLGQIAGRSRLHGRRAAAVIVTRRQHQDRQLLELLVGADEAKHFEPVHIGHVQIQDDQANGCERQLLNRFKPGACFVKVDLMQLAQRGNNHSPHSR